MSLTEKEIHILEHATAWKHDRPLYRNYYATAPDCDDWNLVQGLVKKGLMQDMGTNSGIFGELSFFRVTDLGLDALGVPREKRE